MDRVLVVHESSEVLGALERLLLDHDYRVTLARTTEDAVAAVTEVRPDLVVLGLSREGRDYEP